MMRYFKPGTSISETPMRISETGIQVIKPGLSNIVFPMNPGALPVLTIGSFYARGDDSITALLLKTGIINQG
jgi:hypothetical protein